MGSICNVGLVLLGSLAVMSPAFGQDRWIYDNYPTIGISAFIWNDKDASILALNCTGGDGKTAPPLAMKVGSAIISTQSAVTEGSDASTPLFGNMKAARATAVFDDSIAGPVVLQGRDYYSYVEAFGDRCSLGLDRLRKGRRVTVVAGAPNDPTAPLEFTTPSGVVSVQDADDIKPPLASVTFGLRGSAAAIDRMLANCPAAQQPPDCPPP